jgi:hypothetical protein
VYTAKRRSASTQLNLAQGFIARRTYDDKIILDFSEKVPDALVWTPAGFVTIFPPLEGADTERPALSVSLSQNPERLVVAVERR